MPWAANVATQDSRVKLPRASYAGSGSSSMTPGNGVASTRI
jgi:hypothetical protein